MDRRGGKRPGAGRKKGSVVRATKENRGTIEELARQHTPMAIATLVAVASKSESDAARVAAANSLIDRGYGKPRQSIEHTGKDGGPIQSQEVSAFDAIESQLARLASRETGNSQKPN